MSDHRILGEHTSAGFVLPVCMPADAVNGVRELSVVDGDVLVASYPKTGSTWMLELAWCVWKEADLTEARQVRLTDRVPFLELRVDSSACGMEQLATKERPAIMKTHLTASLLDKVLRQDRAKFILTMRDPRDTLVSFYHFYRMSVYLGNFPGSWDDFFELFKAKRLIYGDYFDWYASWLPYTSLPNVRVFAYEDMKLNAEAAIEKLAGFLGRRLSGEDVRVIAEHTSFKSMKSSDKIVREGPNHKEDISPFMRKGEVGDWRNYFSREQEAYVVTEFKRRPELGQLMSRYFD